MTPDRSPGQTPAETMPGQASVVLAARGLTLGIAGKKLCVDLNIELHTGENWAVLGANGSGKTTLLHTLAGVRAPDAGEVHLLGRPLAAYAARARARHIGLLLQDHEPAFPATALETVLTGRHPHVPRWRWESDIDRLYALESLAAVAAADLATRPLDTLSGGERRRVEIAALLAQDAPIGLYDEPTNHLDLKHCSVILAQLAHRAQVPGRVNVFVLHDVNLAARIATHALVLLGDGAWLAGETSTVLRREVLEHAYGCRLREIIDDGARYFVPG